MDIKSLIQRNRARLTSIENHRFIALTTYRENGTPACGKSEDTSTPTSKSPRPVWYWYGNGNE